MSESTNESKNADFDDEPVTAGDDNCAIAFNRAPATETIENRNRRMEGKMIQVKLISDPDQPEICIPWNVAAMMGTIQRAYELKNPNIAGLQCSEVNDEEGKNNDEQELEKEQNSRPGGSSTSMDKEAELPILFCEDEPFVISHIQKTTMDLVLKWCEHYAGSPGPFAQYDRIVKDGVECYSVNDEDLETFDDVQMKHIQFMQNMDIPVWDMNFFTFNGSALAGTFLCSLIEAADYLDIKDLMYLACKMVAVSFETKSVEEIRKFYGIQNDYTEEELKEFETKFSWWDKRNPGKQTKKRSKANKSTRSPGKFGIPKISFQ